MQTKSPLVRIGILAGVPLAILALFLSVQLHRRAHSSPPIASTHTAASAEPAAPLTVAQKENLTSAYGSLPLAFEANRGQTAPEVRYLAHGQSYQLFLTNQEAVLTVLQPSTAKTKSAKGPSLVTARMRRKPNAAVKTSVLRMHLEGANPNAEIAGTKLLPGKTSYFIGNDPKKWRTDIPSYEAVRYQGIYPGVDVLFYGRQQRLEYDFIVAPGADPKAIALSINGARKLELDSQGDVLMSVAGGKVALQKPVIYQEVNGERQEIAGNYTIANDHQIHFAVAPYDHTQPLTIDPVLNYSTYVGGETFDQALGLALDAAGDAYITGLTTSTKFPQMNPISGTAPADLVSLGTAFVTELNPTGTALIYSTYLGGSGNAFGDEGFAIALDAASPPNIYMTGFTGSSDFPLSTTVLPFQGIAPASVTAESAAFVTELAPSASGTAQLAYSTYLGGDINDEAFGIAVDAGGKVYVVGVTQSTTFPKVGTQITPGQTSTGDAGNAFLSKFDPTVSGTPGLLYSTYIGGSGAGSTFLFGFADTALAVTVDVTAHAYLVGGTMSGDFPVAGTAIPGSTACGANGQGSAFITVVNTTAQTLTYSHCLSGNPGAEAAFGVNLGTGVPAVATKIAYITGTTSSANFPITAGSIPPPGAGVANGVAFVSLLNTLTGTLQYSTFLGGNNSDTGFSIASDSAGLAYVAGLTGSPDFPITQGALQVVRTNPQGSAFVSKISPNGQGLADLVYSSYFTGQVQNAATTPDSAQGIAVSGTNAFITGYMTSPDMLTSAGAFQTALGASGATNAFVADLPLTPTITITPASNNFGTQLVGTPTQPFFFTITNNTTSPVTLPLTVTITATAGLATDFSAPAAGGTCSVGESLPGGSSCTLGVTYTPSAVGSNAATLTTPDSFDTPPPPAVGHPLTVSLTGTGSTTAGAIAFSPTNLTFAGQLLTTTSAAQTVTISNPSTVTPLTVSAITIPGTDPFTIASDSCTLPVVLTVSPGGNTCALSITFNPGATTTPGPVSSAITVTDTANGSPQTVVLAGTAWDFSVTAANISVARGATGMFPVVVTGLGGFTGAVASTCAPGTGALITSCSVPTANAAPAPGTTVSGSITAASFIVPPQSMKVPPSALLRQVLFIMMVIGLLFLLPEARRFRTRLGLAGAMMVFVLVAGCSGGPGGGSKSSTITITPSSGGVTKTAITVNVTIAARPHLAGVAAVECDDGPRLGRWAVDPHRKEALFDQAAIFGARGELLADIAAFFPIDAVEFVEAGFEQDRFVEDQVAAAVRHAETEAQPVVFAVIGLDGARFAQHVGEPVARQKRPRAELDKPRIDKNDTAAERSRRAGLGREPEDPAAEYRGDRKVGPLVEGDLGAQTVHRQPPLQIGQTRRFALEPDLLANRDQHEIMEVFALRGQQRRIDGPFSADPGGVVRNQALQKARALGAADGEHAAVFQYGEFSIDHRRYLGRICVTPSEVEFRRLLGKPRGGAL